MSSRPWYKWFPGDFLTDTRHLTYEEQGFYRAVLDEIWMAGPLPDDEQELARRFGQTARKFRRLMDRVSPMLERNSGLVDHPKLSKQRAELSEKSKKARKAGRKGGLANARATRAGARAGTDPDPEKDLNQRPDQDLQNKPALPRSTPPPNSDARAMTAEERQQAEAMQADLEARRTAAGIRDGPRPIGAVARLVAGKGGCDGKTG